MDYSADEYNYEGNLLDEAENEDENLIYQYKTDLNHLYDESNRPQVENILSDIGFSAVISLFNKEKIDLESFYLLDKGSIMNLLRQYPIGIRLKFIKSYYKWKSGNTSSLGLEEFSSNDLNSIDENTFELFLNSTTEGKSFKDSHPFDVLLTMDEKKELSHILCSYLLVNGKKIGKNESKILSASISKIYKKENPEIYFCGDVGVLYSKAKNITYKINEQKSNGNPKRKTKKRKLESEADHDHVFSADEVYSDEYIRKSYKENSDMFFHHWNKSMALRNNTVRMARMEGHNILTIYKAFAELDGYQLINLDFDQLYNFHGFKTKWKLLKEKLYPILIKNIKNADIKTVLNQMDNMSNNSFELGTIYGLFGYLYSGSTKKGKSSSNNNKPESIKSTFDQIFPIAENFSAIENTSTDHVPIPFVFTLGSEIANIQHRFIVYVENFNYEFKSFCDALEVLLKSYILFYIDFPKPSINVFNFLCNFFFGFNYDLNPKAKALFDELNEIIFVN